MEKNFLAKTKIAFLPLEENNYRPRFLESRLLWYYLCLLVVLKLVAISFFICLPKSLFFADITKGAIYHLVNQSREELGLAPLKESPLLEKAAFLKAKDMLGKGYFSHQSPEGNPPWYWLRSVGYNYQLAGENLAIGFLDSEEVNRAWLDSPSHRANLLNPKYQEVGIAVVRGKFQGNETNLVVQFFGARGQALRSISQSSGLKRASSETVRNENQVSKKENPTPLVPRSQKEPISSKEGVASAEKEVAGLKGKPASATAETALKEGLSQEKESRFLKPLFSFLVSDYYSWLQYFIYGSLIFILILLLINIFVRFDFQRRDLIFKALGMVLLLIFFSLLDKNAVLEFVPHTIII